MAIRLVLFQDGVPVAEHAVHPDYSTIGPIAGDVIELPKFGPRLVKARKVRFSGSEMILELDVVPVE
ncbi:MAG TPA: hypothetical protein VKV02_12320 [Acidobacteriaceae bacterium]|nr:hypothetical protein [Acidobacteriaceae bacterium]